MNQETLNRCSYQVHFGDGYKCRLTGLVSKKKGELACVAVGVTVEELNDCAQDATGQVAHAKNPTMKKVLQRRIGGHGTPRQTENKVEAEDSKKFTKR